MKIETLIERYIQRKRIKSYALEYKQVDSDTVFTPNQVFFCQDYTDTASPIGYRSDDELVLQKHPFGLGIITENTGFLKFLSGAGTAKGYLLTISEYQAPPVVVEIITNKEEEIVQLKASLGEAQEAPAAANHSSNL